MLRFWGTDDDGYSFDIYASPALTVVSPAAVALTTEVIDGKDRVTAAITGLGGDSGRTPVRASWTVHVPDEDEPRVIPVGNGIVESWAGESQGTITCTRDFTWGSRAELSVWYEEVGPERRVTSDSVELSGFPVPKISVSFTGYQEEIDVLGDEPLRMNWQVTGADRVNSVWWEVMTSGTQFPDDPYIANTDVWLYTVEQDIENLAPNGDGSFSGTAEAELLPVTIYAYLYIEAEKDGYAVTWQSDGISTSGAVIRTGPVIQREVSFPSDGKVVCLVTAESQGIPIRSVECWLTAQDDPDDVLYTGVYRESDGAYVFTGVGEGTYRLYVSCEDAAGESSSVYSEVTVQYVGDTEAPEVTGITPADQSVLSGRTAVSLRAQDNLAVTASALSYSLDDGENWIEFARAASGELNGYLETGDLPDGEVLIRGLAWDEAGNESEPVTCTWQIDNTGSGGNGSATQYELEELEFSSDTIFAGNSVEITWYLPSDVWEYSFEWMKLFCTDANGNTAECDDTDTEWNERGGSSSVSFGPEESGVFTFFVRGETGDGELYEFTSSNTLTVQAHDLAVVSAVWKNADGQEITSAFVGQPVSVEWSVENVNFSRHENCIYVWTPDGENEPTYETSGTMAFVPVFNGTWELRIVGTDDDGYSFEVRTSPGLTVISPVTVELATETVDGKDRVTATITGLGGDSGRIPVGVYWGVCKAEDNEYQSIQVEKEIVESWTDGNQNSIIYSSDFTWGVSAEMHIWYLYEGNEYGVVSNVTELSGYPTPEIQISFSDYPDTVDVSGDDPLSLNWRVDGADRVTAINWEIPVVSMGEDPSDENYVPTEQYSIELDTESLVPNADGSFSGTAVVKLPAVAYSARLIIGAEKDGYEYSSATDEIHTTGAVSLSSCGTRHDGYEFSADGTLAYRIEAENQGVHLDTVVCKLVGMDDLDDVKYIGTYREADSTCLFTGVEEGTYRLYFYYKDKLGHEYYEACNIELFFEEPMVTGFVTERGDGTVNLRDNLLTAYVMYNSGPEAGASGCFRILLSPEGSVLEADAEREETPGPDGAAVYSGRMSVEDCDAGSYEVYLVLSYGETEKSIYAGTVTVVRAIPQTIENLTASDDLTCIRLSWLTAEETDTAAYGIYRRAEGEDSFRQVATVEGRENCTAEDADVTRAMTYEYYVVAVSEIGETSEPGEPVTVTHMGDTEAPVVTGITPADQSILTGRTAVSLRAQDNLAVTASALEYSLDGGETWTEICSAVNGNLDYDLETGSLPDGEILIRGLARDEAGNESEPVTCTWYIDNTGPEKVTGLSCVSATPTVLTLQWNAVTDDDISYYVVERKNEDGSWREEASVYDAPGIEVRRLAQGTAYTFRVYGVDLCGNHGTLSDELTVSTVADAAAPTVTGITPADQSVLTGRIAVSLRAQDNRAVTASELSYSLDGGKTWIEFGSAENGNLDCYLETGSLPDGEILIRGLAWDEAGNESDPVTCTWYIDNTGPEKVTGLACVSAKITELTLQWNAVADDDISYYVVERKNENGTWRKTADVDGAPEICVDGLLPDTAYTFRVHGVDLCGNHGTLSDEFTASTAADSVAPVVTGITPADQSILTGRTAVSLRAQDNLAVTASALEYSLDGGENWTEFARAASGTLDSYLETGSLPDGEILIRGLAWDEAGNESEPVTCTWRIDNTGPEKVTGLACVSAKLTELTLQWNAVTDEDISCYTVEQKNENGTWRKIADVDGAPEICVSGLAQDTAYTFRVYGVDLRGNHGTPSDEFTASTSADDEAPVVTGITPANHSRLAGRTAVSLRAQDNLAVTASALSYSLDGGETWIEFGSAENGNLDCYLETGSLPDGEVLIRGLAWDEAGNESEPVTCTWRIDNTGPEKVTGLECVSAASTVLTLKWNKPADDDISYFVVERKNEDGTWQEEASVHGTLGINVRGLAPDTAYTFRVYGVDLCGNHGTLSDEFTASTAGDTVAPTVTEINPASGAYAEEINLSATAADDWNVASVTFQARTEENGEWLDLHTESFADAETAVTRTARYVLDLSGYPEGSLFIRAVAADSAGNVSDTSETAPLTEYLVDRTAPAAPTGVTAAGRIGAVEIAWAQGQETDLGTYSVYRADAEDGEYAQIASGLAFLNYFDRLAETGVQYAYRVRVCDQAGNLSEFSQTVTGAAQADEEAPVIANFYPEAGSALGPNGCTLQVLATDNNVLDSVLVEYSTDNAAWHQAVKEENIGKRGKWVTCALADVQWTDGGTIFVRAAAEDTSGNRSALFECTYRMDTTPPEVVSAEAAYSEDGNCVLITWQGKDETDLAGYRIYRENSAEGDFQLIGSRTAADPFEISDRFPVPVSGEFIYRIEALDNCENAGVLTVSCPAPEETAEEGPTAELSCDTAMEAETEYCFDASASTGDITEWHFDFGDGSESSDRVAYYAYAETGEYTVTLTVTDANGRQDSTSRTVTVGGSAMLGTLSVTVVDENNVCIPGASVHLDLGDEHQTVKTTDGDGTVSFTATAGAHVIAVVVPGNRWLPAQERTVVTAKSTTDVTMTLTRQDMIEASFDTHQMTWDEMEAAGIDPTDPANRNHLRITLHLRYQSEGYTETLDLDEDDLDDDDDWIRIGGTDGRMIDIKGFGGGGGGGGHFGGSDYQLSEPDISLAILDVPVTVSALKDFFDVKLHIINNASSEFSFLDNRVSLSIPEGLSLMQTYRSEKSSEVTRAEIKGQTRETFQWILRGDAMGDYHLSADYSGILSGFNMEIGAHFKTATPIHVPGLSGASVTIELANELDNDRLYYNVLLENTGETDLYCPDIETEDDLIRMDLFDPESAEQAKQILYNAEMLDELSISVAPTVDPNVFSPGALLIKHYVTSDETQYTENRLQLWSRDLEGHYGIQVRFVIKDLWWFKSYLGIGADPVSMDPAEIDTLMDSNNYAYWIIYNTKDAKSPLKLKSKWSEFLWDAAAFGSGGEGASLTEVFDVDHVDSIEALIASAMDTAVRGSKGLGEAETVLKWLKGFRKALKTINMDKVLEESLKPEYVAEIGHVDLDFDASELMDQTVALVEREHKGEMIDFIKNGDGNMNAFLSQYMPQTDYYNDHVEEVTKLGLNRQDVRENVLGGTMTSEGFRDAWQYIGYGLQLADLIVDTTKDTEFDLSIALTAQFDRHACDLFLDALYKENPGSFTQSKINTAVENIRYIIDNDDELMLGLRNFLINGMYKGLEYAGKKGVKYIEQVTSSNVILNVVRTGLKIVTTIGNEYFHVGEINDIADKIRFLSVMSEDIVGTLRTENYSAEDTVQLYSYLLQLRRLGESQVAQLGIAREIDRYFLNSEAMFMAVRGITIPDGDRPVIRNWQAWRDYVEDRISAMMVNLLHKPVYPYGANLKAPVVTVDYANCQTAQRFSADYEWKKTNSEDRWEPCDGNPIPVEPRENPYVLMVRNVKADPGEERLTAAVLIDTRPDLSRTGITITPTETGYLLEFPDNDLTYSYTLSADTLSAVELEHVFADELAVQIPDGSYSCELEAGEEIRYLYLRSAATPEQFASLIWQISLEKVQLGDFVFSDPVNGTVELIAYNGSECHLEIPDNVPQDDGSTLKVVGIGKEALKDHTEMETVWIPDGIATIGASAFEGCTGLTYAAMPESMKVIGSAAFRGCASLGWASLPASVTTIGGNVFAGCAGNFTAIGISGSPAEARLRTAGVSFTAATALPAKLTEIAASAFENSAFTAAVIPAGCSSVGSLAFAGCPNLRVVYLESGTAVIGAEAFPDQTIVFYAPADSEVYRQLKDSGCLVYRHH